jgi:hypothetical protein
MKKIENYKTLEERMLLLLYKAKSTPISIGEILTTLSGKGKSLLLILLCLPFCQPIQIPGVSTPFGLAIAFLGLRLAFGKQVWLPKSLKAQTIRPSTLEKLINKSLWLIKKSKRWLHPRLAWLYSYRLTQIINGMLVAILGILLALPLPIPFSNMTAAWSIVLLALGMLEEDGFFLLAGYVLSLATFVFFTVIGFSLTSLLSVL